MEKTQILMNKPVYLGLSVLDLSKTAMYEFWYDYIKPKSKLCYIDTGSFFIYEKTDDIHKDIEEDVETNFETSNYELDRPFCMGKNEKVIGKMKDELHGQIMKKFV